MLSRTAGSSLFTQVIVLPAATVIVAGANWLLTMETTVAACARARCGCCAAEPANSASAVAAVRTTAARTKWTDMAGLLGVRWLAVRTLTQQIRIPRGADR